MTEISRQNQNYAGKRAVEMPGLWKAWKAKGRLPPLSTSPLGISPKTGEIPTFPQLRRRGRMEKWKTKSRFSTFPPPPFLFPKTKTQAAGGAIARAAALRAASTNDIYQFGNIPY